MGDAVFDGHYRRLRVAMLRAVGLEAVAQWIEENTWLRGDKFSYVDHEYQQKILNSRAQEIVIKKCSQVGISELSIRKILAESNLVRGFTTIYTLPTATFAKGFVQTRMDPIIRGSPVLRENLDPNIDNFEIKGFRNESLIHIKGSQSGNAPISTPADSLAHDELDFSDQTIISQYQSRLKHSKYKKKLKLSTPTVPGYGISDEFEHSRRNFLFVKCSCCGHMFVPDYYQHVRVPGWRGDLTEITKRNLHTTKYKQAFVECPACSGKPSLQPEFREWVTENPTQNFDAEGFQVSPFDAPNVVSCADMIVEQTKYTRKVDFDNFTLGKDAADAEAGFSPLELAKIFVPGMPPGFTVNVMGVDVGMVSHVLVGAVDPLGGLLVIHREKVPMHCLVERRQEICAQFRVQLSVIDSQPYTETVLRMQEKDANLYASVFMRKKGLALYAVKTEEEDAEEAVQQLRQLDVNRDKALDAFSQCVRSHGYHILDNPDREEMIEHMCDMKRIRQFSPDQEESFTWTKSARGEDHWHFAGLYLFLASRLRGLASSNFALPWMLAKAKVTP